MPPGPKMSCGMPVSVANSLTQVPPPNVCTRMGPVERVRTSVLNIATRHSGMLHLVKLDGSKVLSSSTCTMSGYDSGERGIAAGSPDAVAPHSCSAWASSPSSGMRTSESLKLTKKLVICASSESFSHTFFACTSANGPFGSRHTQNASPQSPCRSVARSTRGDG